MKVLLAFDSYKGSLDSWQVGSIAARAIQSVVPDAKCEVVPMADGGEGTVEAIVRATGGIYETIRTSGPMGAAADTRVGFVRDKEGNEIAVLEVASICGLTMVGEAELNPLAASSAGVGEVIVQLLDKGIRRFTVGLGGSATNDGGMGLLAALGVEFQDEAGARLAGSGRDLLRLASIQLNRLDARLAECSLVIATDVSNPLCGPQGATMVYGRQKGVTVELGYELDKAMNSYALRLEEAFAQYSAQQRLEEELDEYSARQRLDESAVPYVGRANLKDKAGAGAAGGLGFALMAVGGEVVSGADWIIDMTNLEERAAQVDWVITGEGRSDLQTLYGKLPLKVAQAAKRAGADCILMSGSLGDGIEKLMPHFQGCFSIVKEPSELDYCIEQAEPLLEQSVREVFRLIHSISKSK